MRLRVRILSAAIALGGGFLLASPNAVPTIVDAVRSVVGPGPIAWLEDRVYGVRDAVEVRLHGSEAPTALFVPPAAQAAEPMPSPDAGMAAPAAYPNFPPANFAPIAPKFAAAHDGEWIAVPDDVAPGAPPALYKAGVHPDATRPYAVVAVAAMYMPALSLHLVAGTREPESESVPHARRAGRIPPEAQSTLVAAFNGGWQAIHGHFGMMVDGDVFLPPRDKACTLGIFKDGQLALTTWTKLAPRASDLVAYRQGPRCLIEDGTAAGGLKDEALGWGASVDGETVIRRSAIGISADGLVLYYGMGDDLTARTVADALARAGARTVMELDINASFPRFLLYSHPGEGLPPQVKSALMTAKFVKGEYVDRPWYRDFFYLRRRTDSVASPAVSP